MRITQILLCILTLSGIARAATSLKLTKHKTDAAAYLKHLERRGIVPNKAEHRRLLKRHAEEVQRARIDQGLDKRDQGGLVYQYVEGYNSRVKSSNVSDHIVPVKRHALISKRQFGHPTSSTSSQLTSDANSDPSFSSSAASPTINDSSSSSISSHPCDDGQYRWAAAVGDSASPSPSTIVSSSSASQSPSTSPSLSQNSAASASSSSASTIISVSVTSPSASLSSGQSSTSQSTGSSFSRAPQPQPSDLSYGLDDKFGIAYTIDAQIGEEKTPVPVLVDTGSATFWVASKQCQYCATTSQCSSCTASKMTQSLDMGDTCPKGNETNSLYYGKGKVHGCVRNTRIGIGELYLEDFPVVGVTSIDKDTAQLGDVYSGMWGIASKNLNALGDTPIDTWYADHTISAPEVGFYLVRENDTSARVSEVIIGDALNLDQLSIPINREVTAKLPRYGDDSGHYTVKLDGMSAWGNAVTGFEGSKVILDTGTTMLIVPQSMLKPIFGTLMNGTLINHPLNNEFLVPCNLMPLTAIALTLTLGGVGFPLQFQDVLYGPVEEYPDFCYGAFMSLDDSLILLGGTFLVNVYHSVNTQTGEVTMFGLTL